MPSSKACLRYGKAWFRGRVGSFRAKQHASPVEKHGCGQSFLWEAKGNSTPAREACRRKTNVFPCEYVIPFAHTWIPFGNQRETAFRRAKRAVFAQKRVLGGPESVAPTSE